MYLNRVCLGFSRSSYRATAAPKYLQLRYMHL